MNMTTTFLAILISTIDSGYWSELNWLTSEINALFVYWYFFLQSNSLIFLWKLNKIIIISEHLNFGFKKMKRSDIAFHNKKKLNS